MQYMFSHGSQIYRELCKVAIVLDGIVQYLENTNGKMQLCNHHTKKTHIFYLYYKSLALTFFKGISYSEVTNKNNHKQVFFGA